MYREVRMTEAKEVLRLWLARTGKKRIAAQVGIDVKTVRRYARAALEQGLRQGETVPVLGDEVVAAVLQRVRGVPARERGEAWARCEQARAGIEQWLKDDVRLTKCQRLLRRQGVEIPYGTLYRFAVQELGFGGPDVTVPVADGEPGQELQLDTGWMTLLEPDESGTRRRFKAFIFTPNVSRYRFVPAAVGPHASGLRAAASGAPLRRGPSGGVLHDGPGAPHVQRAPLGKHAYSKHPAPPPRAPVRELPPARYLRDPRQYALLLKTGDSGALS